MMTLIIAIHIIACALLIGIILIQSGRGGGLVDSFSGVESMFGTKTNTFLTRTTTVLSVIFFVTCLSLAILSARQSRSLMRDIKTQDQASQTVPVQEKATPEQLPAQSQGTAQETSKQEAPKQEEAPKVK